MKQMQYRQWSGQYRTMLSQLQQQAKINPLQSSVTIDRDFIRRCQHQLALTRQLSQLVDNLDCKPLNAITHSLMPLK